MEKRDQRARRDRRRDGNRNTFQNEQKKETVKQQESVLDKKKNDGQNVEVSNKKNTPENKTIEDDPLRFANLKRETDEIAALKAKKPYKRQVFSNWSKYEVPLPSENESQAVDFETLLHAPQSGNFRFKSEQQWDTGSFGQFGELFTPDVELLVGGLTSLPFYKRLSIDKSLFLEEEIERMDRCAKANYVAYEKLSKSKPKPKIAASDLFKVDQAEKYNVVDQPNGATVELGTSTSKPVFSVEEWPDASPAELSLPTDTAGSSVQPSDPERESMRVSEHTPEGATQDFHFEKPPPSSYCVARHPRSQGPSRESTPLRDSRPEFQFERAPPPSYASSNLKSPFQSRESTPAKETATTTLSRHFASDDQRAPRSRADSAGQVTGREGTRDPVTPSVPKIDTVQKIQADHPNVTEFTALTNVQSEDVSSKEETPASERHSFEEDIALRETSPAQKITDDYPQVTAFPSREVKPLLDKIPSKVETPGREETQSETVPHRNSANALKELAHNKYPSERDTVVEQNMDENGHICAENDSYSKKRGKPDTRKMEGQRGGGGRHGRRKKGQHTSARDGEQLPVEDRDVGHGMAEPEAQGAASTAAGTTSPVAEEAGHEGPHPAKGMKKKPERPPPPAVLQQEQVPPVATELSSVPTVLQQTEEKVPQPVVTQPEEPKPQHAVVAAVSADIKAQAPQKKTTPSVKLAPISKEHSPGGRKDDDGLNFLMSLRGQKTGVISEVEMAKSAAGTAVSRSAIEEDELKESQKPKPPPVISTEKKEDLEDWLDSMLDD